MRIMRPLLMVSALAAAPLAATPLGAATILPGDITAASPIARIGPNENNDTPIIGGATGLTLTAAGALTKLGLTYAPFGTATLFPLSTNPLIAFLITGGSRDADGDLLIEHDGSGLEFAAGGSMLRIGDFLVDTDAGEVRGSVVANGTAQGPVRLFTFDGPDLRLLLSSEAAAAFTTVFNAPNLAGTEIGTAVTLPIFGAVPEPASWALLIGGFALLGATVRRRTGKRVLA